MRNRKGEFGMAMDHAENTGDDTDMIYRVRPSRRLSAVRALFKTVAYDGWQYCGRLS